MYNNKIGDIVREMRLAKKMTQKQLAEQMNISDKAISKWECGQGNPDVSLVLKLSNILQIDPQELLSGYEKRRINFKKKGEKSMCKQSKKELKEKYKNRVVIGGVYCFKCNITNQTWLRATTDMKGMKNRFVFSVSANSCPDAYLIEAWKQHGAASFSFEMLEEIEKKETQTDSEFLEDVNILLELWKEKNQ